MGPSPWDDPITPPAIETMFNDPLFIRSQIDALRLEEQRELERLQSDALAERRESRTQFSEISDAAALDLAQDSFPSMLTQSLDALQLPAGVRLEEILDESSARVVDASGNGSLLLGSEPIAVKDGGALEPVDLDLEKSGDEYAPENSTVDVSIPVQAEDFLRIGVTDLGLRPHDVDPQAGVQADGRIFYAGVAQDTDFVSMPTRSGAEVAWQLRSRQAPEELVLDLSLPAEATAELVTWLTRAGLGDAVADGSVVVRRNGVPAEVIAAPHVVDADGVVVDSAYELRDGQLAVIVKHRALDLRYPLLVDPAVNEVWGLPELVMCGGPVGTAGRWTYQHFVNGMTARCTSPENGGAGLFVHSGASYYGDTARGQWIWSPPAGAYLMNAWFDGVRHRAAGTWLYSGLYGNAWGSVINDYGDVWNGSRSHTPNSPYNSFSAVLGLWMNGGWTRPHDGLAGTTGVNLRLGDLDPPIAQLTGHSPALNTSVNPNMSPWIDPTRAPYPTANVSAVDGGLGIWRVGVSPSSWNGQDASLIGKYTVTCAGHRGSPCPKTLSQSGIQMSNLASLGEGVQPVRTWAQDIIGNNGYGSTWNMRLDKTAPVITLSGELVQHATDSNLSVNPTITINAKDGAASPASAIRSGVKQIRLFLDNNATPLQTWSDPASACDSCERQLTWAVPRSLLLGSAGHVLKVEAVDYLNHVTVTNLPVSIETAGPSLTATATPGVVTGFSSPALSFAASDSGIGLSRLKVRAPSVPNWTTSTPIDYGCSGGASSPCSTAQKTGTFPLGDLPEGTTSVEVTADDALGNTTTATVSIDSGNEPHVGETVDPSLGDTEDLGTRDSSIACLPNPCSPASGDFVGQAASTNPALAAALSEDPFPAEDLPAPAAQWGGRYGLADNVPSNFNTALFDDLELKRARTQVPWDIVDAGGAPPTNPTGQPGYLAHRLWFYNRMATWFSEAKADGLKVTVSFKNQQGRTGRSGNPPDITDYSRGIDNFRAWLSNNGYKSMVEAFIPYNEPNLLHKDPAHPSTRIPDVDPVYAGRMYVAMVNECEFPTQGDCMVVAGDFTDQDKSLTKAYLRDYWAGARRAPIRIWALHPYRNIWSWDTEGRWGTGAKVTSLDRFAAWIGSDFGGSTRIWLSEIGGLASKPGWGGTDPAQQTRGSAGQAKYLFDTLSRTNRVTRVYYYQWQGDPGWDSGLLDRNGDPRCQYYKLRFLSAGYFMPATCSAYS